MENLTIKQFSEKLASSEPTPGGGGACGLAGNLAASLAQMVTNLTIGKKNYLQYETELKQIKAELDQIRIQLLNSIDEDAKAFAPLAEVYKLDKNTPNYETKKEECLMMAAKSPLNILQLTTQVIDIDERLANIGSLISISDAATSVMIAQGVLYGTYVNVLTNTRLMKDKKVAEKMNNDTLIVVHNYSLKAQTIFEYICKRLNNHG